MHDVKYFSSQMHEKSRKRDLALEEMGRLTEERMSANDEQQFKRCEREVANLNSEITDLRAKWEDAMAEGLASGRFTTEAAVPDPDEDATPGRRRRRSRNPWAEVRSNAFLTVEDRTSLALDAIEAVPDALSDDDRQKATAIVESMGPENSELVDHVLATSNPVYSRAWRVYFNHPTDYAAHLSREELDSFREVNATRTAHELAREARAALSLSGGAPMLPLELDPTIMLSSSGSANAFRQISRVVQTTQNVWHGVTSAGVTAEWLAESTEAADKTPTVSEKTVTCYKAAAYLEASLEVAADSSFPDEVGMLLNDAKANLENDAFSTGSGSGQPTGIVTALGLVTASRVAGSSGAAGAADLVRADLFALDDNLPPRFRPGASFMANKAIWNKVRQLGTSSPDTFWIDFAGATPSKCIGYNVYEASGMDSTIVSGSTDDVCVLGRWDQYIIADRIGMSLVYNPLVLGSNRRPLGNVGWFAFWRVGADAAVPAAFRMLRL